MRDHPGLASCAVSCRHCGIRFLTHPRNANRRDLFCAFGCREHHRRQQANERSKKHYRTDRGRRNKKLLNGKRSAASSNAENGVSPDAELADTAPTGEDRSSSEASSAVKPALQSAPHPTHQRTQVVLGEAPGQHVQLVLEGFTLDEATLVNSSMLPYLGMVAGVIEGRSIGAEELLQVLQQTMRQRSFDRLPRREYALRFLNQHPP